MANFTETYTGTDGTPLTGTLTPTGQTGATAQINGNRARIVTTTGGFATKRRAITVPGIVNGDATFTVQLGTPSPVPEHYIDIIAGGNSLSGLPTAGYQLSLSPQSTTNLIEIYDLADDVDNAADSASFTFAANTTYRCRFQFDGTTIRAKVWAASGSEPGSWQLEITGSAAVAAGSWHWAVSAATTARTVYFDDLAIADLDAPALITGVAAGTLSLTGTATGSADTPPGDGTQAAVELDWGSATGGSEDFADLLDPEGPFEVFDVPAPGDQYGIKDPDQVSVVNGVLVIEGSQTGGIGGAVGYFGDVRQYGRWESRVRYPRGDWTWRGVGLLWPEGADTWPDRGEIDYFEGGPGTETGTGISNSEFTVHAEVGGEHVQDKTDTTGIDLRAWNNFAVEWTPTHVRGYLNGAQVAEVTDPDILANLTAPMWHSYQLDWMAEDGIVPATMQVAWLRIYDLAAAPLATGTLSITGAGAGTRSTGATAAGAVSLTGTATGVPPAPEPGPLSEMLVDDFNDNTIGPLWTGNYGTTSEVGGRARVACVSGADTYAGFQSSSIYSFDQTPPYRVYPPALSTAVLECYAGITVVSATQADGSDITMYVDRVGGNVEMMIRVDYFEDDPATSVAYNATTMAWMRMRRATTSLIWETAPDASGVPGTWTTQRTATLPSYLTTAEDVALILESHRDAGTGDYAEFDTINNPEIAGVAAGTLSVTGAAAGARATPASAGGVLALTGSALATRSLAASAAGTLSITGDTAATRATLASAAGALALTGTAAGTPAAPQPLYPGGYPGSYPYRTVEIDAVASGAVSFIGSATGARVAAGAAAGALSLVGAASADVEHPAQAAGELTLTGTVLGVHDTEGVAAGDLSFIGTAAGARATAATAAGALSFVGSATNTPTGSAAGALSLIGGASATVEHPAATAGELAFIGSAAAGVEHAATAAGALTLAGLAAGTRTTAAQAAGAVTITGTATNTPTGVARGALSLAGSATGTRTTHAAAAGALSLVGLATGVPDVPATAAGELTLTGTAAGTRATDAQGHGALALTGTAAGTRTTAATAAGTLSIVGEALAIAEGQARGGGELTITGTTTGTHRVLGAGAGAVTIAGAAAATKQVHALAAGAVSFTGSAAATRAAPAQAAGAVTITGAVLGEGMTFASAAGSLLLAGTAVGVGYTPIDGTAGGELVLTGAALNGRRSPPQGSWWGLKAIIDESRANTGVERERLVCPNDLTPLIPGPGGVMFCTFDGYRAGV